MAIVEEIEEKLRRLRHEIDKMEEASDTQRSAMAEWIQLYEGPYCGALHKRNSSTFAGRDYTTTGTRHSHMYMTYLRELATPLVGETPLHPASRT